MALDAGVAGLDVVHVGRIENVGAGGIGGMLAAGAVAAFAAYVPLGDLLGVDVEVDGMAAVAGRGCRALHVIGGIERLPPVGTLGDKIGPPDFGGDVPLRGFREVVVANFREVTLLPDASVDESDILL